MLRLDWGLKILSLRQYSVWPLAKWKGRRPLHLTQSNKVNKGPENQKKKKVKEKKEKNNCTTVSNIGQVLAGILLPFAASQVSLLSVKEMPSILICGP